MAVPQTAFTLDELVRKVAAKLGVEDYRSDDTPMVPVSDPFKLEKCGEMVQRGINLLIDAAPREGWRWMRRTHSETFVVAGDGSNNIDSDAARYMLPLGFGGEVVGDIRYTKDSNHSTNITWVPDTEIKRLRADYVNTGYPTRAAFLPYQPTTASGTGRRWELIVDPQPSSAETVELDYILHFDGVLLYGGTADSASATTIVDATFATTHPSDDTFNDWYVEVIDGTGRGSYAQVTDYTGSTGTFTVADWLTPTGAAGGTDPGASSVFIVKPAHPYYHPVGFAYDGVIETACLAACEIYGRSEMTDDHFTSMFYNRKVPEAHNINRRQVQRRPGVMTRGGSQHCHRQFNTVTTDHDV